MKDNQVIKLVIGSKEAEVNGVVQTLQCAPKIIDGTTMVPIRLVSENLGSTVTWEKETGTVIIKSNVPKGDTGKSAVLTVKYANGKYVGEVKEVDGMPLPHGNGKMTLDLILEDSNISIQRSRNYSHISCRRRYNV